MKAKLGDSYIQIKMTEMRNTLDITLSFFQSDSGEDMKMNYSTRKVPCYFLPSPAVPVMKLSVLHHITFE